MTDQSLKQHPLPATARQIKAALAARYWIKSGYRIHHVRPQSNELNVVSGTNYFAGAVPVQVSDHPGVEMLFFSDDNIARVYFYFGRDSFESTSVYLWAQLATQARGVLDVGAYTGLYALLAARVAPRSSVVAFEPSGHIADRLKENAALNALPRIVVRNEAISDFDAISTPSAADRTPQAAGPDLWYAARPCKNATDGTVRSIDGLDQDGKLPAKINLIRIGTNCDAYAALDGARLRIAADRPMILADVHDDDDVPRIAAFAHGLSYGLYFVNEEARSLTDLMSGGDLTLPKDLEGRHGFGNVLLCPDTPARDLVESLVRRFAQKPRILRQVQSEPTPSRRQTD